MPTPAQISYSIARVWNHHTRGSKNVEVGRLLVSLLALSKSRGCILSDLVHHFVPEAENPISKLLRDVSASDYRRAQCAGILMTSKPDTFWLAISMMLSE
ncbi:hypothetical protein ES708_22876 [subsurface metagenome]